MNDQILYWLWLQCCLGENNSRLKKILKSFGGPQEIFDADRKELMLSGVFTAKELEKIAVHNTKNAEMIYQDCRQIGCRILPIGNNEYPQRLKEIAAPPMVLYIRGVLPDSDRLHTAVVGTRNCTEWGKQTSFRFGYDLAQHGVVIVSGGALGVDTQAHLGAIQAGGKTICVLGCGINYKYLMENKLLRDTITDNGALISAYPPNYPSRYFTFPIRNRIISGLSHCTLVVEAGARSGALITAKDAAKQQRTVFAVPGDEDSPQSMGTNRLIQEGAEKAADYRDILDWNQNRSAGRVSVKNYKDRIRQMLAEESYSGVVDHIQHQEIQKATRNSLPLTPKTETVSAKQNKISSPEVPLLSEPVLDDKHSSLPELSVDAAAVYAKISHQPVHVDNIKVMTGLSVGKLLTAITELEMYGLIESLSGRNYIRK